MSPSSLVRRSLLSCLVALIAIPTALLPAPASAATTRLSGRVIDSESQHPIEGAEVELANTSGGQGFHRGRTNKRGEFAFDGVSTDRYYGLTVSAAGYADFVIGGWQIPAAQRAAELAIPLDRAGVMVVRATRSDGRTPILNARVQITSERGSTWWEGYKPPPAPRYTDAGGATRFEGLTAGYYSVTVDAEGLRTAEARRIAVRRGETTNAPVKLGKPASIAGFVRTADGTGVPGVTITARGPSEQVATSGTEGAFALGDLAAGKFRLEVSHEGFEPFLVRDPQVLREGDAKEIPAITLKPKPAELAFVLEREAFLPDVPPAFTVRSFRVGPIDLSLWIIPASCSTPRVISAVTRSRPTPRDSWRQSAGSTCRRRGPSGRGARSRSSFPTRCPPAPISCAGAPVPSSAACCSSSPTSASW
jgi:hypothetical protein